MNVWIQRHDFSAVDLPDGSMEPALESMAAVDWKSEATLARAAEEEGRDCCPAGIGFVDEDGRVLHLMPDGAGCMNVSYLFPTEEKLFGFLKRTGQGNLFKERLPADHAKAILNEHYQKLHRAILARLS